MFTVFAVTLTFASGQVCIESAVDRLPAREVVAALEARVDQLRVTTCRPKHRPLWRLIVAPEPGGARLSLARSGHLMQRTIELEPDLPTHMIAQLVALAAAEALMAPGDVQLPGWTLTPESPAEPPDIPTMSSPEPVSARILSLSVVGGTVVEPAPVRWTGGGEARLAFSGPSWAVGALVGYRNLGTVTHGTAVLDGGHLTMGLDARWIKSLLELGVRGLARRTSTVLRGHPDVRVRQGSFWNGGVGLFAALWTPALWQTGGVAVRAGAQVGGDLWLWPRRFLLGNTTLLEQPFADMTVSLGLQLTMRNGATSGQ